MELGVFFPGCCFEVRKGREKRRRKKRGLEQQGFPFFSSSLLKYVMYIIFKQVMVNLKIGLHVFN